MEEAILMTTSLLVGAGAGALIVRARDRNLLQLYGRLVGDLSRMVRNRRGEPPEPPATTANLPQPPTVADLMAKRVS